MIVDIDQVVYLCIMNFKTRRLRRIIREIEAEESVLRSFIRKTIAEYYGRSVTDEKRLCDIKSADQRDFKSLNLKLLKGPNTKSENSVNEMLMIRTMVAPSRAEGEGLYAAEFIPKGKVVSQWVEGSDRTFSKDYPDSLPIDSQAKFKELASWDGDSWFMSGDDGVYFNHSNSPNIRVIMGRGSPATWDRIATRDIQSGEELTMDYREIGLDPL